MKWSAIYRYTIICFVTGLIVAGCKTHFKATKEFYTATKYEHSLERGKNLTFNVCGQCHYNREEGSFIGKQMKDLPGFMGKVYSANITQSPVHGIDNYTDAELKHLLKTGVAKDGRFIPYMVRPTMSDRDINDIIVYLQSGDEPVKASDKQAGKTKYSLLGKIAIPLSGKPQPYIENIEGPSENDPIAYGRYLVDVIGCYHCHSKSIMGLNYTEPEKSKGYIAGGMKYKVEGEKVYASNITPDIATGIGRYTREDFRKALHEKIAPDGRNLKYPMPKFKHLTNKQTDAIYAYIMSLPAKDHKVNGH